MPAPKGNKFAAKLEEEKLSAAVYVRMTPTEKGACEEAAGGQKFSAWARRVLLDAAQSQPTNS